MHAVFITDRAATRTAKTYAALIGETDVRVTRCFEKGALLGYYAEVRIEGTGTWYKITYQDMN